MITIQDRLKRHTICEFIERRQFTVNLVILPLWLPGLGMVAWNGKYGLSASWCETQKPPHVYGG